MVAGSSQPPSAPPGLLRLFVLFHESEVLGAGTAILRVMPQLRRHGWTPSAWFPGEGPLVDSAADSLAFSAHAERPIGFSVRTWRSDPGVRRRLQATPEYLRSVRRALLRARPHVVHANTLLALPEALVARRLGLPVALHVHEIPAAGPKRSATLRLAARSADVFVAVCDSVRTMLAEHTSGIPILTVPNGVQAHQPTTPPDGPLTFGTIATVSRTKGTDVLLRAAILAVRQRPGLRFEHVGQTDLHRDRDLDDEIRSLLASPELEGSLSMLGRRPASESLPRWHGFVLASRNEAFPLATLEAMADGLPVIATAVGGLPEQIRHMETGILVPPEDPAALANAMVLLNDDSELRQRLGLAAARSVRERFTLERQGEGLHRAYLSALNLRHGPPVVRRQILESA